MAPPLPLAIRFDPDLNAWALSRYEEALAALRDHRLCLTDQEECEADRTQRARGEMEYNASL